jgi:hypothetical protein
MVAKKHISCCTEEIDELASQLRKVRQEQLAAERTVCDAHCCDIDVCGLYGITLGIAMYSQYPL